MKNSKEYLALKEQVKLIRHKRAILDQAKMLAFELGDEGLVLSLNLTDEKLTRQYWEAKTKQVELLEASAR